MRFGLEMESDLHLFEGDQEQVMIVMARMMKMLMLLMFLIVEVERK